MSQVILQEELATIAGVSQRAKLEEYCRREGIRFKCNWKQDKIYTTQKWLDDSQPDMPTEDLSFGT